MVSKELIQVQNRHRKEPEVLDALTRAKDRATPKLTDLLLSQIEYEDTRRLRNWIIRHNQELLLFLDDQSIKPTSNRAERQLRPMVIMRKVTLGNRSDSVALNQATMMSIIETGAFIDIEPLDNCLTLSLKPLTSLIEFPKLPKPRPS